LNGEGDERKKRAEAIKATPYTVLTGISGLVIIENNCRIKYSQNSGPRISNESRKRLVRCGAIVITWSSILKYTDQIPPNPFPAQGSVVWRSFADRMSEAKSCFNRPVRSVSPAV
jgi:hypothetical protein